MRIEFQLQSITIEPQEAEENFSNLFSVVRPYLPNHKYPKRRKPRRKYKTASILIDRIISDIETE